MQFYADSLNYFDHGPVNRAFVKKDVERFYQRWPQRHYRLESCTVNRVEGPERDVTFTIAFEYKSPTDERLVKGRSANRFRIRWDEAQPRFTVLKEQRLRN